MEPKSKFYLFLSLFLLLAFTLVFLLSSSTSHLPYTNPSTDLLLCSHYSPWCTFKNRIQSKSKSKSTPQTNHHNHETDTPHHPLDPLTITEINRARSIVLSSSPFSASPSSAVFHSLVLHEPDKSLVTSWLQRDEEEGKNRGFPEPRRASVVVRFRGQGYVLTVDLVSEEVSHLPVPASGFPTMTIEDMTSSTWAPLSDPEFNRTVLSRGIQLSDLACLPISSGW